MEATNTYSLNTKSGAKYSIVPLVCLYDLQLRLNVIKHIHEYRSRVIWSSSAIVRNPAKQNMMTINNDLILLFVRHNFILFNWIFKLN